VHTGVRDRELSEPAPRPTTAATRLLFPLLWFFRPAFTPDWPFFAPRIASQRLRAKPLHQLVRVNCKQILVIPFVVFSAVANPAHQILVSVAARSPRGEGLNLIRVPFVIITLHVDWRMLTDWWALVRVIRIGGTFQLQDRDDGMDAPVCWQV